MTTAYKGFNSDWTCREFQYKVGEIYKQEGKAIACYSGFHACENPLDILTYYPPTGKFAEVHLLGDISREVGPDTKVASTEIFVKVEISLHDFVAKAVKWLMDNAKNKDQHLTGDQSAAMGAGYKNKVMGKNGCAIFLVERNDRYDIINARGFVVGRDCKADQWYMLENNELVEVG